METYQFIMGLVAYGIKSALYLWVLYHAIVIANKVLSSEKSEAKG